MSLPLQPRSEVIMSEDRLQLGVTRESELCVTSWHDGRSWPVLHMLALITRRVSSRVFACFHKIHIARTHCWWRSGLSTLLFAPSAPLHPKLFIFTFWLVFFSICNDFFQRLLFRKNVCLLCLPSPLTHTRTHQSLPPPSPCGTWWESAMRGSAGINLGI